jgi:regulatory protein
MIGMDIVKVRKIKLSLPQALDKIKKWCAYQERSHFETRGKLYDYGLSSSDIDEALAVLVSENFLNEERFAETFARGKFRIKQWGRNKIKAELKFKKVSDYSIKKALKQIDNDEYLKVAEKLVSKKLRETKEKVPYKKNYKVLQYAVGRGFEMDIVADILKFKAEEEL